MQTGRGKVSCSGFSAHEGEIKVSVKTLGWTSGNADQRGIIWGIRAVVICGWDWEDFVSPLLIFQPFLLG